VRQPIPFDLKSLHRVQGLADDFDALLRALVKDAMERPGVTRKRELKMLIEVTPSESGDEARVAIKTTISIPARTARKYHMFTTTNAGLKFTPANPESPEQTDILDDED
jgi:hypothetical protein